MFHTSDGVALHVEDSADPDAPVTVVLAHGWTSDRRVWDTVAPLLASGTRVIRFDQRGHGSSGPSPDATLARLGDDLAELIAEYVPTGTLVLVGHSMGGMAMMALAARHPELVRSRVHAAFFVSTSSGRMSEITFGLPRPVVKTALTLRSRLRPAARHKSTSDTASPSASPSGSASADVVQSASGATAALSTAPPTRKPPTPLQAAGTLMFLRWLVFGRHYRRADLRSTAAQLAAVHARSAAALRNEINRHTAAEALHVYRDVPTQVITGQRDRLIPAAHSHVIAAELPDAALVVYPDAGHMLPYERAPELVARILSAAKD